MALVRGAVALALLLGALAGPGCGRVELLDEAGSAGTPASAATGGTVRPAPVADPDATSAVPTCTPPPSSSDWQEVLPPPSLDLGGLVVTGAWAAGADDIFFAGVFQDPGNGPTPWDQRVLRWKSGCWTQELASRSRWRHPQLSGTAPDDVWAALGHAIYHRDAAGWAPVDLRWEAPAPPPATIPGASSIFGTALARFGARSASTSCTVRGAAGRRS
jgi:hypothetical protein